VEFLDLIETIRAEEASVARLYGGDGRPVRGGQDARYLRRLAEAAKLIADVKAGRRPIHRLQEAMTTSDFPQLMGDILDRQLLGSYTEAPYTWNLVARRATVPDFRTVKRFTLDGAEGTLDEVKELAPYPAAALADGQYSYSVKKHGRRLPMSWETVINDDLDAFSDIPNRFGRAARRSEEKFVTELFVDASGPHASFFTSGNRNIINATNAGAGFTANNPPLSIAGLQQGMAVLANQVDADGEPIAIDAVTLVVPPALEVTANNIINAVQIEIAEAIAGGTSNQRLYAANWMAQRTTAAVNRYIPRIATTANGNTSWFLFARPGEGRPALEIGFLRGHEAPEVFMKLPNQVRVGGGGAAPMEDFDIDAVDYKVRHVYGGVRLDPKAAVASNGSGS
jgi:hypothetical protein